MGVVILAVVEISRREALESTQLEMKQPTVDKVANLGTIAVTIGAYLEETAATDADRQKAISEKTEAIGAAAELASLKNSSSSSGPDFTAAAAALEKVEDSLSNYNASLMLTGAAAAQDGAEITADTLAELAGGVHFEEVGLGNASQNLDVKNVLNITEVFEGDMLPADMAQAALFRSIGKLGGQSAFGRAAGATWPNGVVKFCFASDIDGRARTAFLAATYQFQRAVPCLTFQNVGWLSGASTSPQSQQKCQAVGAIFVQSHPQMGCVSYVGKASGPPYRMESQLLNLQTPGCTGIGTAIHELGHALGMAHEQSRSDRNKYVTINWWNIREDQYNQFNVIPAEDASLTYDYQSVMHYGSHAFAKNRAYPTIEAKTGTPQLGNRAGLSQSDADQVAAHYSCASNSLSKFGCLDMRDAAGLDTCSSINGCNTEEIKACCACGGGITVQCYEGEPCPNGRGVQVYENGGTTTTTTLPPPAATSCLVDATHLYPGYDCVYQNICKFDVTFQCGVGGGQLCQPVKSAPGYWMAWCDGSVETRICQPLDTGLCKVWK